MMRWLPVPMLVLVLAAAPAVAQSVIQVPKGGQPYIGVTIKDVTLKARIALGFDAALLLNQGPAERAKLKMFPLLGKARIKNTLIPGGEALFRFNLYKSTPTGYARKTLPTVWVDKPIAGDADGILSVMALEADRISLVLGPDLPGSRTYKLVRDGKSDASVKTKLGDEKLRINLELNSPETILNARAGEALLAAGLVRRTKQVGLWRPFPGVALPFQRLQAVPGARLLGLPIVNAVIRVTEAEAKRIDAEAKAGTSTAEDDEDAITVTASREKRGRSPWALLGRDLLDQCSRILLDRPGKSWDLTCRFDAG